MNLHRSQLRLVLIGALLVMLPAPAFSDEGVHDPEFDRFPFAQWFSEVQATLKWSAHAGPVVLGVHQRLVAHVQVELQGSELVKRRGVGKVIFYFQFTDARGRVYQDHASYDLEKVEEEFKPRAATVTDNAFILPGDYGVAFAIYDTATGEHAARKETLHVPLLNGDPLPEIWRDLPSVDFIDASDPPDSWFLPKERGKLNLALLPQHPVRIEIVANLTSPEGGRSSYRDADSNVRVLLPFLKVLSGIRGPDVSVNVALLDFERRRVMFEQRNVDELNWEGIRPSLAKENAGLIDATSLKGRPDNARFFVREVAGRLAPDPSSAARVVIVLSSAITLDAKQNQPGVRIESLPGSRIFYIRLRSAPHLAPFMAETDQRETAQREAARSMPRQPTLSGEGAIDELEHMLSGAGLRLFNVATAEEFRNALSVILSETSRL